ncbi:hypothetical protein ABZZ20_02975 [Streptomyces sp. NPDC006430]|uniref:hypothetical protein n=1 Tax=Streptomyces sp. NPDC006430 TaxID=3154299 RepID=UPI0033B02B89
MNHSANIDQSTNINHDAVLRARVALLGSEEPSSRQQVAAYRVLVEVNPLVYLPRLAVALLEYSRQEFAHQPQTALALRAESVAAARRMCALEPGREGLLLNSLTRYREQLVLMDRQADVPAVDEEIALIESDHGRAAGR